MTSLNSNSIAAAKRVLEAAKLAIELLENNWDESLVSSWTKHIIQSKGRLVLSGMGKSGLIAQKISATMASTGCPSFYLHPADALHGDLGMVMADDTALILSNSGESEEIVKLLPNLTKLGVRIGAITAKTNSSLGKAADWCFTYQMPKGEGCPLNFAPMASTTLQLVWGDLLASYHMLESGFTLERFTQFHPGGNIGTNLLKTKDLMHNKFPTVASNATLVETLMVMTHGKLGMTTVLDNSDYLLGVISDGDVRRAIQKSKHINSASDIMTTNPVCIHPETLAIEAAKKMETNKITFVIVVDANKKPCGVIHIHDLFTAKVIY